MINVVAALSKIGAAFLIKKPLQKLEGASQSMY
jgi:hypothetical protein